MAPSESISLQRRVICEPDFLDLAQEPPAAALRCNCRGRLDRRHPRSYPELRLSHVLAAWRVKADCPAGRKLLDGCGNAGSLLTCRSLLPSEVPKRNARG